MTPSISPHTPSRARHATPDPAPVLALRIGAGVDADRLSDELGRAWRAAGASRRDAPGVAMSIVETCGRTPAERERDALRLLDEERRAAGPHGTLRATLVSLGAGDHLLLLAAAPGATVLHALSTIAEELGRFYPIATIAPG